MWLGQQTVSSLERCSLFGVSFIERFHCVCLCVRTYIHYRVRYEYTPASPADYDAPVNEFGQPTIKFLILREMLPNLLPDFGKYRSHIDVLFVYIEAVQA